MGGGVGGEVCYLPPIQLNAGENKFSVKRRDYSTGLLDNAERRSAVLGNPAVAAAARVRQKGGQNLSDGFDGLNRTL